MEVRLQGQLEAALVMVSKKPPISLASPENEETKNNQSERLK